MFVKVSPLVVKWHLASLEKNSVFMGNCLSGWNKLLAGIPPSSKQSTDCSNMYIYLYIV